MGFNIPRVNNAVLAILPQVQARIARSNSLNRPSQLANRYDAIGNRRVRLDNNLLAGVLNPRRGASLSDITQNSTLFGMMKDFFEFSIQMIKSFFKSLKNTNELITGGSS